MRELHGVMFGGHRHTNMKRQALLFDKLRIWRYDSPEGERAGEFEAEISFLKEQGVVEAAPLDANDFADAGLQAIGLYAEIDFRLHPPEQGIGVMVMAEGPVFRDISNRAIAAKIRGKTGSDVISVCETGLPEKLPNVSGSLVMSDVLTVAIEQMPYPTDSCPWQDIIDFKREMLGRQWTFRRFLSELGTQGKTERQIVDEFEYLLDDYKNEMDRYKLQRSISVWETYIVPTVEALESLKPSSFAKGWVGIKKRKLALMEWEAKQNGKPIAYLFEAQKEFGKPA